MFEGKRVYLVYFAGFFLLEALLSLWTGLPSDMNVWFKTGVWMNEGINIYAPPAHLGYPPLWALWCLVAYRFYSFFGNSLEIWRFVLKLPLIISHLALAYSVGKFAEKEFARKRALKIFYLVLTWSFFIFIGALWGQINTLSALLTFLAFEAVISQRTRKSALLLGIAVTLKIYPLIVLPAFLVYILKKQGKKEAVKFSFYTFSVPILFTLSIFMIFQWDIKFFLQTISYGTPFSEVKPTQMQTGCMNLWSFFALLNINLAEPWPLRLIWIPIIAGCALYWLKKPSFEKADLNLALITFYAVFMISYGWVTEQTLIDPLPFIFLQVLGYRSKRFHLYVLGAIQILVYAFSAVNGGEFIFEPLLERFFPPLLVSIQNLYANYGSLIRTIRGMLGLIISLSLGIFLIILMRPSIPKQTLNKLYRKNRSVIDKKTSSMVLECRQQYCSA